MPRDFGPDARAERARDLALLVAAAILLLIGRLAWLQMVRSDHFLALAEENRVDRQILRAERGRIFDRNGEVLADNVPTYRVTLDLADRALKRRKDAYLPVVASLAEVLGREPNALALEVERLKRHSNRPIPIARNLSFEQVAQLEERMDRLPGVQVETESSRRYPGGVFAGHLLGYLGEVGEDDLAKERPDPYHPGDLIGQAGIEKFYEAELRGRDGEAFVEVDAFRRRTHYFPELPSVPASPGHDLYLTIDARLQRAAEQALDEIRAHGRKPRTVLAATGGAPVPADDDPPPASGLIAIDPRNGDVLALASRPSFDPNLFLKGISHEEWRRLSDPNHPPLLNRAIQASYPPGSTFKCLTSLAGLDAGIIDATRHFSGCGGGYHYGNRTFGCWRRAGHGSLALLDALARSCDVYYYQVGIALGVDRLARFAEKCHMNERTGIDLPQERNNLIPTPEWYAERYGKAGVHKGAALNVSIGQGEVLQTPASLARFTAAIANGGHVLKPHLLLRVQEPDGKVLRDASEETWEIDRLPSNAADLALVQAAMERVVMDAGGTGGRAKVGQFRIAGKTGTAQNPHGEDHALFVCYAPVDDPRIVVAVVIEEAGHGGSVAAPVAQRVLAALLQPDAPVSLVDEDLSGFGLEGD